MDGHLPKAVEQSVQAIRDSYRRAKLSQSLTIEDVSERARIATDSIVRISTGKWMEKGLKHDTLKAVMVDGLQIEQGEWESVEEAFEHANRWRKTQRSGQHAVIEPVEMTRIARTHGSQPGRGYPTLDVTRFMIWPDGRLEGTIERIEPESRRGAIWSGSGREINGTLLMTFWPSPEQSHSPGRSDSAGHLLIQREASRGRPWPGKVVKLIRTAGGLPKMVEYDSWLSPLDDRKLVSAASTVAVLDFDNTLADGWILEPWVGLLAEAQIGESAAAVGKLQDLLQAYKSRSDFGHDRLARDAGQIYGEALKGVPVGELERLAQSFTADYVGRRGSLFASSRELVSGLRSRGLRPILMTGAPEELVKWIAPELDIENSYSLVLEKDQDHAFTGKVEQNVGVSSEKTAACESLEQEQECRIVVAIGDSEGDRGMWQKAEIAIRVGKDGNATADKNLIAANMDSELDDDFWSKIPTSSWLGLIDEFER